NCVEEMASTLILPACLEHRAKVANSINPKSVVQCEILTTLDSTIDSFATSIKDLQTKHSSAKSFDELHLFEQANFYKNQVLVAMEKVRTLSDTLEGIVEDKLWPLPKYSEILFLS